MSLLKLDLEYFLYNVWVPLPSVHSFVHLMLQIDMEYDELAFKVDQLMSVTLKSHHNQWVVIEDFFEPYVGNLRNNLEECIDIQQVA